MHAHYAPPGQLLLLAPKRRNGQRVVELARGQVDAGGGYHIGRELNDAHGLVRQVHVVPRQLRQLLGALEDVSQVEEHILVDVAL